MRKMIAGLALGLTLAAGGMANAECIGCDQYDVKLSVNVNPFYGKWAIVDDRPYVGVEALSDALGLPRKHNYKAWNINRQGMNAGDPLMLMAQTPNGKVNTIRFAGVTMVDLYGVAAALDLPVHHNFRNKTFQLGSDYNGEEMIGAWYRYMARTRGWRDTYDVERVRRENRKRKHDRESDDLPWERRDI